MTTVATSPPSDSVCDFDHGLCGWTHDPNAPLLWSLHSHELNSYLYMDASLKREQQRARLVSPVVAADTGPLCLLFSYQLSGEAQGHLKVLLRDAHNEETDLWTLKDDQGPVWKEGRTILPRSPKDFQVVMEGFFVHGTRGHIWIDNIHMSSSIPLKECTQPFAAFSPENSVKRPTEFGDGRLFSGRDPLGGVLRVPEWNTASPSSEPPVTRVSEKDNSWLYTLDPILVTIIVMSSLGVLLGAVCCRPPPVLHLLLQRPVVTLLHHPGELQLRTVRRAQAQGQTEPTALLHRGVRRKKRERTTKKPEREMQPFCEKPLTIFFISSSSL
ncbi:Neuropilin-2 [Larimichthys crocea]|uniref:Uncharacterized protein n=1 Tax=Larimichthys crocea TaxID=215358 RepID=A0ACD3QXP3_LARCR|nr:Neuropilin-2 [Larimichthys crocea]